MKWKLLAVLAMAFFLRADASHADDKADLEALQGDWKLVAGEESGKPGKAEGKGKELDFKIKGETVTSWLIGVNAVEVSLKFKIDSTKNPKTIDLLIEDKKDAKPKALLGIYSIEGDTLKVCFGEVRPKEFKTKPGTADFIWVLKKAKK
jgi:uncharacterized protein (TIGR03067 family)